MLEAEGGSAEAATVRLPSAFNTRGSIRRWRRPAACRPALRGSLEHLVDEVECTVCGGSRLRDDAAAVRLRGRTIDELCRMPLGKLLAEFQSTGSPTSRAEDRRRGAAARSATALQFLVDVGLEYLTLARPAPTLSGGEMQRIRLAAQVGSGLCGVLYVLDEPTIGLHPRDNRRLLGRPEKAPRPGQHAAGGRARPRGDRRAPTNCSTSAPARAATAAQIVAQGTPAASGQPPRLGHRALSVRQEGDPRADQPADARTRGEGREAREKAEGGR